MNPFPKIHADEDGKSALLNDFISSDDTGQTESFEGFDEVNLLRSNHNDFRPNLGSCTDAPTASEMMKLNGLENASVPLLFTVVKKLLDDSIGRKNGDLPQSMASLLKIVVQEIEHRNSKQVELLKKQHNLYKSREDKYRLRLQALETLAIGTAEENKVVLSMLKEAKIEMTKMEEQKRQGDQDLLHLMKEKEQKENEISSLKEQLDLVRTTYEEHCLKIETEAKETGLELKRKMMELENLLSNSRKRVLELEACSETKFLKWKRKELGYKRFMDELSGSVQELRTTSKSIKQEVFKTKTIYSEEFNHFGSQLKGLVDAAQNYHTVLEENRKLYNEVQDLKGNIRVYCRIRPFLPGQSKKETTIEYIGENGELVVVNPSKQGKDSHRLFKFNKVFGPTASQEEVFLDTQPLVRSVLDGYNVCIFAYGQTGSGKTYTMAGPSLSSTVDWGVNYRALNDLFHISESRKSSIAYDVGVQMVEIYNEQVRDLLSTNSSQKRLGIWSTTQPNGLAVPDASMHPVKSISDVLELMDVGIMNRAVGATALNERSSRSHSILTVHVCGLDLETNALLRGCLHLVDLAGSERVERSEATGDRLREAQHINKSLSALGDVIFALAQKNSHVPYRNSKLTQVLQSSLGGQAKTLMFVQLNPDVESYLETISTLKFAERVSGVELGAARSNREGRGVRELIEQMEALKDTIAKKDAEIGCLRLLRSSVSGDNQIPKYRSSSPRRTSYQRDTLLQLGEKGPMLAENVVSKVENYSKCQEVGQNLILDLRMPDGVQNVNERNEILEGREVDSEERLSDISEGGVTIATETDDSVNGTIESRLFPGPTKASGHCTNMSTVLTKLPRGFQTGSSQLKLTKSISRVSSSAKKASTSSGSASKISRQWP